MSNLENMNAIFDPHAIVVFGSMSPDKPGTNVVTRIMDSGFPTEHIHIVCPNAEGFHQVRGYASVFDIEDSPDLAIILSPATIVPSIMDDCGKIGIKTAIIMSAGFSEAKNALLEEDVKRIARKHGIRFIGPNSSGVANTKKSFIASTTALKPGNIGLITQSGALGGMIERLLEMKGLGLSKFADCGNSTDIDASDILEYLSCDDDTKLIAIYIEGVKDGRAFYNALCHATQRKPVVIIKSGAENVSREAALYHTASCTGQDRLYNLAFKESGTIRVESVEELVDICSLISLYTTVNGNRTLIISNSGGSAVMTADKCETVGLLPDTLSKTLARDLAQMLPSHASIKNPLDITDEGTENEYYNALEAALPEYDAFIINHIDTLYSKASLVAQSIAKIKKTTKKPILAFFGSCGDIDDALGVLKDAGVPCFDSGERAALALSRLCGYCEYLKNTSDLSDDENADEPSDEVITHSLPEKALTEPQAMRILGMAGLPVPKFRLALSPRMAVSYAREVGYPVCLKTIYGDLNNDAESLMLPSMTDNDAVKGFLKLQNDAGDDFKGVLISPLMVPEIKTYAKLYQDEQFGDVIEFGIHGASTELFNDTAQALAPLNRDKALDMIRSLESFPLLDGAFGLEPLDIEALCDMIVKLSRLPLEYPQIAEVHLDPIYCSMNKTKIYGAKIKLKNSSIDK